MALPSADVSRATSRFPAASAEAVRSLPEGELFTFAVAGDSMRPVLFPGDEVTARRAGGRDGGARLGDLVVTEQPGVGLVVHRLLWRGRQAARTRGDGSGRMDAPVPWRDLLGTVVAVRRGGRDVTPGGASRAWAWVRGFSVAAGHRAWRRLAGRRWGGGPAARGRDGTEGRKVAA